MHFVFLAAAAAVAVAEMIFSFVVLDRIRRCLEVLHANAAAAHKKTFTGCRPKQNNFEPNAKKRIIVSLIRECVCVCVLVFSTVFLRVFVAIASHLNSHCLFFCVKQLHYSARHCRLRNVTMWRFASERAPHNTQSVALCDAMPVAHTSTRNVYICSLFCLISHRASPLLPHCCCYSFSCRLFSLRPLCCSSSVFHRRTPPQYLRLIVCLETLANE